MLPRIFLVVFISVLDRDTADCPTTGDLTRNLYDTACEDGLAAGNCVYLAEIKLVLDEFVGSGILRGLTKDWTTSRLCCRARKTARPIYQHNETL